MLRYTQNLKQRNLLSFYVLLILLSNSIVEKTFKFSMMQRQILLLPLI